MVESNGLLIRSGFLCFAKVARNTSQALGKLLGLVLTSALECALSI